MSRFSALLWFFCLPGMCDAATQYICASNKGAGDGSTLANCKAAGANFAAVTVSANDVIRICETIRGTLTITAQNDVTVDLNCNNEAAGQITGADIVQNFELINSDGEMETVDNFTLPSFVFVDDKLWKEGIKTALKENEWALSGGKVWFKGDVSTRKVEISTRATGIALDALTGATIIGGRVYGIRHDGGSSYPAGVAFLNANGQVKNTEFYGVRKAVDARGTSVVTIENTRTEFAGDGLDCNAVSTNRPSLIATANSVTDLRHDGWFDNTAISHSTTFDGEGIAATNCAAFTATKNTIQRTHTAIATRAITAMPQIIESNWIEDTVDEGINLGCSSSAGTVNGRVSSNIFVEAGKNGGWTVSSYAIAANISVCGNGGNLLISGNSVRDSSQGFFFQAAASQTGSIAVLNNMVVNVDPEQIAGTHYFVNWASVNVGHALTITENFNRWYQTYGAGNFRWVANPNARSYANWATYVTDSSQNANSALGDPEWTGGVTPYLAKGFAPTSTSPLIGAGTCAFTTGCAPRDFNRRLPRVPPDIGAWQYRIGD